MRKYDDYWFIYTSSNISYGSHLESSLGSEINPNYQIGDINQNLIHMAIQG